MTWRVSGAHEAINEWVKREAPSPIAYKILAVDWLRLLGARGPFESSAGETLAVDPDAGSFIIAPTPQELPGLMAEISVDAHEQWVVVHSVSGR